MGINSELKKVDIELNLFIKNIEGSIVTLCDKIVDIYNELDKVNKKIDEIETKLNK